MQAKVASVADKDTREDILLLAGLGAAIGGVSAASPTLSPRTPLQV